MLHCPYCGSKINNDESYCVVCGKILPNDINKRKIAKKSFNHFWYIPIILTVLLVTSLSIFYFILQNNEQKAKALYEEAENNVLEEDYKKAQDNFKKAIDLKSDFYEAQIALDFVNQVLTINDQLKEAEKQGDDANFQDALTIINNAESSLNQFHGLAVTEVINHIIKTQDDIKTEQLKKQLADSSNVEDLKTLLWQAESIRDKEAEEITKNIQKQIIDYTFSKASEQLNNKQFSGALKLVEDGLKYVADSEKLQSLKTTIDKEKTAFETAEQQRIEKAIDIATEENELNTLDAVELNFVEVKKDDLEQFVVKGEVKSVATIPISSILIEYKLINDKGNELLTNKVFVYPDKLYPDEVGKFEFTHYDIDKKHKDIKVEVNKITWFTD